MSDAMGRDRPPQARETGEISGKCPFSYEFVNAPRASSSLAADSVPPMDHDSPTEHLGFKFGELVQYLL